MMFYKKILLLFATITCCLVLHATSKCQSDDLCGENCDKPCSDQQSSQCPFGFYKFGELCYPLSTEVCPENMTLTSIGCRPVEELCPPSFIYLNGVCVNKTASNALLLPSLCGPNMVLFNGTCVSTDIASCPVNFTLENGICVKDVECNSSTCGSFSCPSGMVLMNNTCITLTCPNDTFKINGICAKCPMNSHFYNGQCTQCPIFMVFNDGLCVCPIEGQVVYNNSCVDINILLHIPVTNYPSEVYVRNVSIPHYNNNNNFKKVNITNKVNSTDVQNVVTRANGTNINNIDLSSFSSSLNRISKTHPKKKTKLPRKSHKDCCIIIHPKNCSKENDKWVCTKRRYHTCGIECSRQTNQTLPRDKIIEIPVPVYKPQPIFTPVLPSVQQPVQTVPVQDIPVLYQQQPQIYYQQPQTVYQEQPQIVYQQPNSHFEQIPLYVPQPQILSNGCNGVDCRQGQAVSFPVEAEYIPQSSCTWPYCS